MQLYIEGFPLDFTERQLRIGFEPYGTVERVSIITDRKLWMRDRGIAFVDMPDDREAIVAANSLSGCSWCGPRVYVRLSRPRDHEVEEMKND